MLKKRLLSFFLIYAAQGFLDTIIPLRLFNEWKVQKSIYMIYLLTL